MTGVSFVNKNFVFGIQAVGHEFLIYGARLVHDDLFIGFVVGIVLTTLIIGFVVSENPRTIPFVLRYSFPECFTRASDHFEQNQIQCNLSLGQFNKVYVRIRILVLIAVIVIVGLSVITFI